MYTEIGIPIKLDMELGGIKGGDTVSCKITPPLNVPEINTTGDSARTVITLNRLGQKIEWYHMDNIDGEIPDWDTLYPPSTGSNTIVDVMNFAPETIEFGGGAEINGAGFLAPDSRLWGSFALIAPMAFIFEQPVNIIPAESTPMSPMEPSTKEQFDSSLVEAALNVNINNSSPLGGNLSLLISDSTIFPLFLDSLITGTWTKNQQHQEEKYGYIIDTSIWDSLGIVIDSISYTELDSSSDMLKALEVKFFREESLQFFIGRMFELGFPRSDSIEYHLGYVNPEFSKTYESSLFLDNTRMNWVITDQQRYNVAMITFDKSPIQSITDEGTSFIPLTLQTSNFIAVQAYLTLTLNTGGLGRENNTGKTAGSGN